MNVLGMLALVVAAFAVVAAGWIGYRATGNPNATVCVSGPAAAVVRVDPENPRETYRLTTLDGDEPNYKVVSFP